MHQHIASEATSLYLYETANPNKIDVVVDYFLSGQTKYLGRLRAGSPQITVG